jgi:hypothetical protein
MFLMENAGRQQRAKYYTTKDQRRKKAPEYLLIDGL